MTNRLTPAEIAELREANMTLSRKTEMLIRSRLDALLDAAESEAKLRSGHEQIQKALGYSEQDEEQGLTPLDLIDNLKARAERAEKLLGGKDGEKTS